MIYVVLAALGIFIVHFCDPAAMKRIPLVKPAVWVIGAGLFAYATTMIWLWPGKLSLPAWSSWLGWALLFVSVALLGISFVINLPFRETYVATGVGGRLITTGFYALVRHPGVLWAIPLAAGFVLVSESRLALTAAPILLMLDVAAVIMQDLLFFRRMFSGYDKYSRTTPMLIPNRKSIGAFISSVRPQGLTPGLEGGDKDVRLG
ncbi:MAG: hypothetical protein A2147_04075 [Chloroflexi bacterium RBG_16_57_8]|nr:MAG: hypothetical protein A2147_04075 [Chloroflexi bacterium RBG_16_57_8]